MTRQVLREMKRAVVAGRHAGARPDALALGREAALHLLERSIGFGHQRLAVIRLAMAVQAGADIADAHWLYCRNAATGSRDPALQAMFLEAASRRAGSGPREH